MEMWLATRSCKYDGHFDNQLTMIYFYSYENYEGTPQIPWWIGLKVVLSSSQQIWPNNFYGKSWLSQS